jgi:8-oxo-dGTP pyrophosphatase MutT (NUDIX family)
VRRLIEACLAERIDTPDPRERFLANVVGEPSSTVLALLEQPARRAAVLIPIIERHAELQVLLTARARHLVHHPGQVAFPGGRIEPGDRDPRHAALREASEEVGLDPAQARIVGELPVHLTGTGFVVTPIVAFVDAGFAARPDPAEVAGVFEVPLSFLIDGSNCACREVERFGSRFVSYEYRWRAHRIWGATAAMIVTLKKLIDNKQ